MKNKLILTLCSVVAFSTLITGYDLKDGSQKYSVGDHVVIITDNTKVSNYKSDPLAVKGVEIITQMDKLAESETYRSFLSSSDDISSIIEGMGSGDYSTPKMVYKAVITDDVAEQARELANSSDNAIKEIIKNRYSSIIPAQLNALGGSSQLAAAAAMTYSTNFINDKITDNSIYVFMYDGDYCAAVSYVASNENIVSATGSFIKSDLFAEVQSAEDMNKLLSDALGISLEFQKVR